MKVYCVCYDEVVKEKQKFEKEFQEKFFWVEIFSDVVVEERYRIEFEY